MANGGIAHQAAQTLGESFVKPVADEVGKMVEVGVQSITGQAQKPVDPAEEAKKKQEEERKKANINAFIDSLIAQEKASMQQKKIQEEQKKQATVAQEEEKKQFNVQEKKQQQNVALEQARTKTETRIQGGSG